MKTTRPICHRERALAVERTAFAFLVMSAAPRRLLLVLATAFCLAVPAYAHVGSPDVYAEGQAGAYKLSVVVRPPLVIPGVADIEVRAQTPGIDRITVTPVPLTGEAEKHPPVADTMDHGSADANFFTAHLWIMATGSWQIRFAVSGNQGSGVLSIPFPATAMSTRTMQPGLGTILGVLGAVLLLGMVGIVGAATREARLRPGEPVTPTARKRAYLAMSVTFAVLVAVVLLGNTWWKSEAASYSDYIYKPLSLQPTLRADNVLDLRLRDPGWLQFRKLDDFIPDHDHLMHLYMIRWPQMDVVFHLHPQPVSTGDFQLALPSLPAGTYRLYADVVHAGGFPETLVGEVTLPAVAGRPLEGDDAQGNVAPADKIAATLSANSDQRFQLPDGYAMVWNQPSRLDPKQPADFEFQLLDPHGRPPADMALYMGMLGHAAFVKADGTVFAHIHPAGTVAMAAFMMANPQQGASPGGQGATGANAATGANPATGANAATGANPATGTHAAMNMPGMVMGLGTLPNTVSFPYGFPSPGHYRIFVQMKHGASIETAAFDAFVPASPH